MFRKFWQNRTVAGPHLLSDARFGLPTESAELFLCISWIERTLATAWRQPSRTILLFFPSL